MGVTLPPGVFSQVMFSTQHAPFLAAAFDRLVGIELKGVRMNAQVMGDFATRVTASISDHVEELSAALYLPETRNIERIAKDNKIEPRTAMVEYLANAYLFRSLRDYFDLPRQDFFPQLDVGGFLAFTFNGSIVASPPTPKRLRALHYTRMPSRNTKLHTSSWEGEMKSGIALGHRLETTAFTASAVRMLLYVPTEKSHLFEAIRESSVIGSLSVSSFVTRKP